jgi:hypothetical protein
MKTDSIGSVRESYPGGTGKTAGLLHQAIERCLVFFTQRLSKALPVGDQRFEHGPVGRDGSAPFGSRYLSALQGFKIFLEPLLQLHFHIRGLSVAVYSLIALPFDLGSSDPAGLGGGLGHRFMRAPWAPHRRIA